MAAPPRHAGQSHGLKANPVPRREASIASLTRWTPYGRVVPFPEPRFAFLAASDWLDLSLHRQQETTRSGGISSPNLKMRKLGSGSASEDAGTAVCRRSSAQVLPCGYTLATGTYVTRRPRATRRRRHDFKTILHRSGLIDDRELIALEVLEMMPTRTNQGALAAVETKRACGLWETTRPEVHRRPLKTHRTRTKNPSCVSKQPKSGMTACAPGHVEMR